MLRLFKSIPALLILMLCPGPSRSQTRPITLSNTRTPISTGWQFREAGKDQWSPVEASAHTFVGTPVLLGRHLAGAVRKSDGGLVIYSVHEGKLKGRCAIVPSPIFRAPKCTVVREHDRTGIRVSSEAGECFYIAWFTPMGVISVEASQVPKFQIRDCRLRYGLLPSFPGTDICYSPLKMPGGKAFSIPSTR